MIALGVEYAAVVAGEADLVARVELADDVAAVREARAAQHVHHARAVGGADLQHSA